MRYCGLCKKHGAGRGRGGWRHQGPPEQVGWACRRTVSETLERLSKAQWSFAAESFALVFW